MFEMVQKLGIRDEAKNALADQLKSQSDSYDNMVLRLTKQKTDRAKMAQRIAKDKKDMLAAKDDCDNDLIACKRAKDFVKEQLDKVALEVQQMNIFYNGCKQQVKDSQALAEQEIREI